MKFIYLLLVTLGLSGSNKFIKNINTPSCKNCIYYKPSSYISDFTSSLNKCSKFGEKNILTDDITYDFADSCRKDENKCGKEGKYFSEEKNINLKILKHKMINKLPEFLIVSISVSYIIVLYLVEKLT